MFSGIISLCLFLFVFLFPMNLNAQKTWSYAIGFEEIHIPGLPGLHSYAYAQHHGKWLVVGGRKDGIHARQPFNAFPESQGNADIYVIDVASRQFWVAPLNVLPAGIFEQLQSTNINFYQDSDTLYLIGGYGFSQTAGGYITFPNLTSIQVSSVVNAVINGLSFNEYFKQMADSVFAVTGGGLGKIGNSFVLAGGQRFDGRYNPMGHPSYVQKYTNQVSFFELNNHNALPGFSNYSALADPIHLRRRDYNLLPRIFPDGTKGYTISSGVFQINADLPFFHPVEITNGAIKPRTDFNQYLSNYHTAKASFFNSGSHEMNYLFFGGIGYYFYRNDTLYQDSLLPFVNTISRLNCKADGSFQEFQLPFEMPDFNTTGAEFILNLDLPHTEHDIILLDEIQADTCIAGYVLGGIGSPLSNPFSFNQTRETSASEAIYAVKLYRNDSVDEQEIKGDNPYACALKYDVENNIVTALFELRDVVPVNYFVSTEAGIIIDEGELQNLTSGRNEHEFTAMLGPKMLMITLVFDHRFFVTNQLMIK